MAQDYISITRVNVWLWMDPIPINGINKHLQCKRTRLRLKPDHCQGNLQSKSEFILNYISCQKNLYTKIDNKINPNAQCTFNMLSVLWNAWTTVGTQLFHANFNLSFKDPNHPLFSHQTCHEWKTIGMCPCIILLSCYENAVSWLYSFALAADPYNV